jgi:hypothetical protein
MRSRILAMAAALVALAACEGEPAPPAAADGACPPWVEFPQDAHSNAEDPYLGCVNHANLEHMVARPTDLAEGRPTGPADAARTSLGVKTYEEGKIKGFESPSVQGPSIVLPGGSSGGQ